MAWSKRAPRGESRTIARRPEAAGPSDSTARRMGSAFITIPGPPPNGVSSTLRWRPSVNSRRSWTSMVASPASTARRTIPSARGAWTMSGKIVTTSILSIHQLRLDGDQSAVLQVDLADERVRHRDHQLAARSAHHEHRRFAAGHQHVRDRAQRAAVGILHLQPLELLMVIGPGWQRLQ